jgi:autotransporter-associated beta strand protein
MAASLLSAEDLVLNGDYAVTVAAGTTQTISDKVSGQGRIILLGGGTLVLNNSANDFSGGIVVSNGVVRADASGAFGTGPITLEGTAALRQVCLNANKGVFPNDIALCTAGTSKNVIYAMKTAELSGDIRLGYDGADGKYMICNTLNDSVTVTFNGDIEIPKLQFSGKGKYTCNGKVIVSGTLMAGNGSEDYGHLTLSNPENEIKQLTLKAFRIYCKNENVLYRSSTFMDYNWDGNSSQRGTIFLEGFNQEFATLNYRKENRYYLLARNDSCVCIHTPAEKPATVTLRGSGSAFGYCRVAGPVSIVVDKLRDGDITLYQRFIYRDNSMTGDFTVKNGNCYWQNGVEFSNLTNLVQTGGSLQFDSVTNCCPKLRKMEVSGGTVEFKSSCKDVFNAELTDLHLSGAAKFYIASGLTNTVRSLYVDGKRKSAGVYTFENLPAMKHETNSGNYSGVLIVNRGGNLRLIVR